MKRIFVIATIIFFIFIIQNLIHSIYSLYQKQELLVNATKELSKEQKENRQLKEQITEVNKPSFIEEQARDKLLLIKPGEQMVIYPSHLAVTDHQQPKTPVKPKPNWQQWWELFFR